MKWMKKKVSLCKCALKKQNKFIWHFWLFDKTEKFCAIVKNSFHFDCFKVYEIYPADLKLEEKLKKVAKRDGNFGEVKKVIKIEVYYNYCNKRLILLTHTLIFIRYCMHSLSTCTLHNNQTLEPLTWTRVHPSHCCERTLFRVHMFCTVIIEHQ